MHDLKRKTLRQFLALFLCALVEGQKGLITSHLHTQLHPFL